jgi:hypothetical protein
MIIGISGVNNNLSFQYENTNKGLIYTAKALQKGCKQLV